MKLVAQFTAAIGKAFIRDLQRGEPDNELFGFLSPMHPRFQYFQRLVDAYSNVIDHFEDHRESGRRDRRPRCEHRDGDRREHRDHREHRDRDHREHRDRGDRIDRNERDYDDRNDRNRGDFVSRIKTLNLDRDKIWFEASGSALCFHFL